MKKLIVNLFDIDSKYLSHPNYSYKNHINNMEASFNDDDFKITSLFHDLGKLTSAFQEYINDTQNKTKTTHSLESAFMYLKENEYKLNNKTFPIFLSILKHHGNLENINELAVKYNFSKDLLNKYPNIINTISELISITGLKKNFDIEKCCEFFDEDNFVEHYNLLGIDSYFRIKELYSRLIFSDKYEAIFKQSYKEKDFENIDFYKNKLLNFISKKQNSLSFIRNKARNDTLNKLNKELHKRIYLIEAPTGIGKTYMALNLALEIANQKKKKRIINALPMTSIIDQTYMEYSNIIDKKNLMKYHHLSYSKDYFDYDKEMNNEIESYKQKNLFISNSWSEDKVIITTFNQILNLFYSNKNRDLIKFWTIRDSIIIFDEIQAIPRVLLKDFAKTINFLANMFNIDFILMSATVPSIKNFLNPLLLCELLDNKYYSLDFNDRYALIINNNIDSEDILVLNIINEFKKNKSVLAVLNTKKAALNIYEKVQNQINNKKNIFLLSSLFIPKHRNILIKYIKRKINRGQKVILISTQVIEAGVDLDFDIGFREFSPLYSIIQSAGRINRENRLGVKDYAKLIVFPQISKMTPYHKTDLLEDDVQNLLSEETREKNLLPLLKNYFNITISRTSPDDLIYGKMDNLEFESVAKEFDNNFMCKLPYFEAVFIEIKKNLYCNFISKLQKLDFQLKDNNVSLEKKMEIKAFVSDLYKEISLYVINVPKNDIKLLKYFIKENEMKYCDYDSLSEFYSLKTGWILTELSALSF